MKWEIDTDKIISTLRKEGPVSLGRIDDESDNPKLLIMLILPEHLEAVTNFANSLLRAQPTAEPITTEHTKTS